ncbi:MAG: carboxypeptidase-like regulatory domain-containing protein [Planctomycetota bacterium]
MTVAAGRRPSPRRAPRVATGLACLGIAVGLASWLTGRFDADEPAPDARPVATPASVDVAATDLAAAPRAVVADVAWVRMEGRVTTPDGGPAAGAHVRVVTFPTGVEVWRGTADAEGRFACEGARGTLHQAYVAPADAPRDETLFPAEAVAGEGVFVASLRSAETASGAAAVARPPAPESTGELSGQVVDEDGVGVRGARVTIIVGAPYGGDSASAHTPGLIRLGGRPIVFPTVAPDGRFLAVIAGLPGDTVSVTAVAPTVNGSVAAAVEAVVGARDVRVMLTLGPTTTLRCPGGVGRVVHVAARRPASMAAEEFEALAPSARSPAMAWRFDGAGELRLRGGDARLPLIAYVGPSATDDRVAWFDGVPVGGDATLALQAGRTVSGRLVGLPATTGGRPACRFEARADGIEGLKVVGTQRGDRYEFRGLPDGTRWDLDLVVFARGGDGPRELRASAEAVAAGADLDLTLRAP